MAAFQLLRWIQWRPSLSASTVTSFSTLEIFALLSVCGCIESLGEARTTIVYGIMHSNHFPGHSLVCLCASNIDDISVCVGSCCCPLGRVSPTLLFVRFFYLPPCSYSGSEWWSFVEMTTRRVCSHSYFTPYGYHSTNSMNGNSVYDLVCCLHTCRWALWVIK